MNLALKHALLRVMKKWGLDKESNPSEELIWSVKYLRWKLSPAELIGLSRLCLLISVPLLALIASIFTKNPLVILLSVIPALALSWYINEYPKARAKMEANKELGYAPGIITLFATSILLKPNLEQACSLVGEYGEGRITKEIRDALNRSMIRGANLKEELRKLSEYWGRISRGFKNGLQLIISSVNERDSVRRGETINLGANTFLDELINDLKGFLSKTRMQTMIIYSFGTVIPLVIISLLPVLSTLSSFANPESIVILLGLSLLGLYAYSNNLLKNRPMSFSQLMVKRRDWFPKEGEIRLLGIDFNAVIYCSIIFLSISSITWIYLIIGLSGGAFLFPREFVMMPLIIGLAVSLGAYYHGSSSYKMNLRNKALSVEGEILPVIYSIALRLHENRSIEEGIRFAFEENKNKRISEHLSRAYSMIINTNLEPERALLNSFKEVDSRRVKSVIKLVFNSLKGGVKAGSRNVLRIYEYYKQLINAETESKNLLNQMLSMMKVTGYLFAPIISAMIVTMQQVIQDNVDKLNTATIIGIAGLLINPGFSFEFLQLVLGIYTILLTIILTRYAVIMEHGFDKVMLNYELGKAVIISTVTYISTLIITYAIL